MTPAGRRGGGARGKPPRGSDRQGTTGPKRGEGQRGGGPRSADPPGRGAPAPGPAPVDEAIIYGRNAVHEALRAGRRRIRRVWATEATRREPWLAGASVAIETVTAEEVGRRAGSDGHQGVCALADPYPYADAADLLQLPAPLIVALDEVQDPQNLGAICRTAECAGADGVVICERRAAQVTAAAVKASAGAIEHLPVARVGNLADFLVQAQAAGCWSYGAQAGEGAVPYTDPDWTGGVVLVLGSEGKGLRPRVAATCDGLVSLPMRGRVGSLNVSAAAAALLYGILQQRIRA
jgi:23S rRNA (guanosine2251-2'-O)-methyltransferase